MGFFDRLKETAAKAADMAKDQVEVVRLNSQISSKKREIEKLYTEIGEAVYEAYQAEQPQQADQVIATNSQTIINIQSEIEELELKTRLLKDQKECQCGQLLPQEARFCSNCGYRYIESVQATVISEPAKVANQQIQISVNDASSTSLVARDGITSSSYVAEATTYVKSTDIATKACPTCQSTNDEANRFCENCGTSLI